MRKKFTTLLKAVGLLASSIVFAQTGSVGINTPNPGSTMDINGSVAANYTAVNAASYNLNSSNFHVSYNGASNAVFNLPAAISGTGNFKGRMYTIKNNTNFTVTVNSASPETINGSASILVPPNQSIQLINTGLTGANPTWEIVSLGSSSTGDYIIVKPTASQSVTTGSDVTFGSVLVTNNITYSAGVFNLKAGKTYVLRCQLHATEFSIANGYAAYQWVDASSNAPLPTTTLGVVDALNNYPASSIGGQPEAYAIYKPAVDTSVKVRMETGGGTALLHGSIGFMSITELSGGNGSGGTTIINNNITASNGTSMSGTDVRLGGTLSQPTNIDNAGNNLSINGNGKVLLGTNTTPAGAANAKIVIDNGTTNGALQIKDGTEQLGYVLTSDANGLATWSSTTTTSFANNWTSYTGTLVNPFTASTGGGNLATGISVTIPAKGWYFFRSGITIQSNCNDFAFSIIGVGDIWRTYCNVADVQMMSPRDQNRVLYFATPGNYPIRATKTNGTIPAGFNIGNPGFYLDFVKFQN
jgi:formylmethanofuran dehydrogenase subunit C